MGADVSKDTRVEAVVRVLGGESVADVSTDLGLDADDLEEWRDAFVEAGTDAVAADDSPTDGRSERAARTRARLLDTAIQCLAELGYAGTSTNIIAQRAGLSRGAQLYHFPTRIDLLVGAIEHLFEERSAEIAAKSEELREGNHRSAVTVDLLWSLFDGPLFYAALELITAARTDEELADRLRPTVDKLGDQLYGICRELLGDELRDEDVAAVFVDLTVMLMYGMSLVRILDDSDDADESYGGLLDSWKWMVDASVQRLQTDEAAALAGFA